MLGSGQGNASAGQDDILLSVRPDLLAAKVSFPFVPEIADPASAEGIRRALGADYSSIRLEEDRGGGSAAQDPAQHEGALRGAVWSLSEFDAGVRWKVALSPDSVELEARGCGNAAALLERLAALVSKVRGLFRPGCSSRVGMRMYCETTERAAGGFVRTELLGPVWSVAERPSDKVAVIGPSRSETVFRTDGGTVVRGRWGQLSDGEVEGPDAAGSGGERPWALDVSLHRSEVLAFDAGAIGAEAAGISGSLSRFVSGMVSEGLKQNRGLFPMRLFREGEAPEPCPGPAEAGSAEPLSPAQSVAEIREISGLVWEEVAELFGVTRRTVHNWTGGTGMTRRKQEIVRRMLAAMRHMDRGLGAYTRQLLMQVLPPGGKSRLDLLKEGRYDEALAGVEDLGVRQEAAGFGGGSSLAPAVVDRPDDSPDAVPGGSVGGDPESERQGGEEKDPLHPLDAILEIRILPGLSWEQVGELFGEEPSTVRGWTGGKPMTEEQRTLMYRLLAVMMHIYRGSRIATYELLMSAEPESGMTRFDLMKEGRFDEALAGVKILGVKRRAIKSGTVTAEPVRESVHVQLSRTDDPNSLSVTGQRLEAERAAMERKKLEEEHVKAGGKLAPRPESLGHGEEDLLSPLQMLIELRINSGLDKKEVAELFGVPWTTANMWTVSHPPMTLEQWELMDRLRAAMKHMYRGRMDATRELLEEVEKKSGKSRFELLKEGRFDEALAGVEDLGLGRSVFINPPIDPDAFQGCLGVPGRKADGSCEDPISRRSDDVGAATDPRPKHAGIGKDGGASDSRPGPDDGSGAPGPASLSRLFEEPLTPRKTLLEIQMHSGLGWDEVAELFGEERSAVNDWVCGAEMTVRQSDLMYKLLEVTLHMFRGTVSSTRELLMGFEPESGTTRFDLMKEGRFDEAVAGVRNMGIRRHIVSIGPKNAEALRGSLKIQFSRIKDPHPLSYAEQRVDAERAAMERKELEGLHVSAGGKLAPRPGSLGRREDDLLSPMQMLYEIALNSGLDNKEVADLFQVTRKTMLGWAGSRPMTLDQWAKMDKLRAVMKHMYRGRIDTTRELLMEVEQKSGKSRFELMKEGRFDEALAGVKDLGINRQLFYNPSIDELDLQEPVSLQKSWISDGFVDEQESGIGDRGLASAKDPADLGE